MSKDIVGTPIISIADGCTVGKAIDIDLERDSKRVKRIHLTRDRFVNKDDIILIKQDVILVKNLHGKSRVPDKDGGRVDSIKEPLHPCFHVESLSPEASVWYWWLHINLLDES